jgi:aryl-alcohol dehydrogenase-like predicted oxidoreductase
LCVDDSCLPCHRGRLGTMTFGAQVDEPAAAAMMGVCLDRGVNFLDTANVYAGGRSEEILGRVLAGRRDRVVLASKVGIKVGDGPADSGLSRAAIEKAVEDSLRRLRTDHLDLYYLHQPDPATPLEESLEAMGRLVRAGKVRHVGASNYAAWQVCRLNGLADQGGGPPVRVVQPMYNLLARGIEPELLPMAQTLGVGVVAYNPLAGGLLTGKHRAEAPLAGGLLTGKHQAAAPLAGTRFELMPAYRDRYWHPANFAAVGELARAAAAAGRSLAGLALAWVLYHTPVDGVIVGASRPEQLRENLDALDRGPLPAEAVASCDRVWKELRGPSPQYNR